MEVRESKSESRRAARNGLGEETATEQGIVCRPDDGSSMVMEKPCERDRRVSEDA
jgi:hypothetical protein